MAARTGLFTASRIILASLSLIVGVAARPTRAEDFFSALFHTFRAPRPPASAQWPMSYGSEGPAQASPYREVDRSGGAAFCVRTCDGRYFPAPPATRESRAASCRSFCPASETTVVYGSDIERAATETGKPYSELANAFKYRSELVPGCTCNGADPVGLARIGIDDDRTLRRGDMVVTPQGVAVTSRSDRHGVTLEIPSSRMSHPRETLAPSVAAD